MPRCRALLVEDEAVIGMMAEDILASAGCEVVMTCHGQTALALIERGPEFQLGVIDLGLPDLGGDKVIKALWERAPVPVIVSTGHCVLPDEVAQSLAPFPAPLVLMPKPWEPDELRATAQRLISTSPEAASPPASRPPSAAADQHSAFREWPAR